MRDAVVAATTRFTRLTSSTIVGAGDEPGR
jgi:hypothetical protein